MTTSPKPTNRAYLISAGFIKPTPTVHHFLKTQSVTVDGQVCREHIFRCFKTGAERRWGLEFVEGDEPHEETN